MAPFVALQFFLHVAGAAALLAPARPRVVAALRASPYDFALGVLGDLHVDPRDLADTLQGRNDVKKCLDAAVVPEGNRFVVSLGDLGESKDCDESGELYAGTTRCFEWARDYFDGFDVPFDVVGGNHDLEGLDEFATDAGNLDAYLRILGKETPQFCRTIAEKTLVVGLGSTKFRDATHTSHEVSVDAEQLRWFEDVLRKHPASEDWRIFCFSHAPIIGSALRVLHENHVINGCCWLNHGDAATPVAGVRAPSRRFIELVRESPQVKFWASGHFHLSHDYEDSITFPGGNNRGSCVFAQTGVMRTKASRDGRRQSRFLRGTEDGFEVCTVNHARDGEVRLDATVTYSDECAVDGTACSTVVFAHAHEDYDHDLWFSAYTPEANDGCYLRDPDGVLNPEGSAHADIADPATICWWHMADGAVLGAYKSMIVEYDSSTLAPLGMVVSADELRGRRVVVIDDGSTMLLYDEATKAASVVQPNEDGSYWRKLVRNKVRRTRESKRVKAATAWLRNELGAEGDAPLTVISSFGPYASHKPLDSTMAPLDDRRR
ncbi:calcineurin-like phosphoesterase [Pelagophyceae sp. CCMP2097]|nr:calcineurin-like phosphoesterase [Pelagophyceae sp. CCMP2097]